MAGLDQTPIPLDGSESFLNRTGLSRANRSRRLDPMDGLDLKRQLGVANNSQITLSDSRINTSINPNGMDYSFRRHVLPENYGLNNDPTMRQLAEESIQEMHMTSKFDELYERVLSETEGALSKARSQKSYPKEDPKDDVSLMEEDALALSQHSIHSQKSQHSNGSHRSHHSTKSQKSQPSHKSQQSQKSQHSQKSQQSQSSHRSHPSGQGQVSQKAEPSSVASQHSQLSHKSHPSQRSQKSQQSHRSEHSMHNSNGISNGMSNGSMSRKKSPGDLEVAEDMPQSLKQKSHEISNGNYSESFEQSLSQSDISEDIEGLLEDPDDQDF